jgi:hypothetical protein
MACRVSKSLRSRLFRGARDLGNLQAARKGPARLRQAGRPAEGLSVEQPSDGGVPAEAGAVGDYSGEELAEVPPTRRDDE